GVQGERPYHEKEKRKRPLICRSFRCHRCLHCSNVNTLPRHPHLTGLLKRRKSCYSPNQPSSSCPPEDSAYWNTSGSTHPCRAGYARRPLQTDSKFSDFS